MERSAHEQPTRAALITSGFRCFRGKLCSRSRAPYTDSGLDSAAASLRAWLNAQHFTYLTAPEVTEFFTGSVSGWAHSLGYHAQQEVPIEVLVTTRPGRPPRSGLLDVELTHRSGKGRRISIEIDRGSKTLVPCAAPPARRLQIPIRAAQEASWDVCVILTPSAYRWATEDTEGEIEELEKLTGHPVRWQYKLPSQDDVLPPPDALLVAPLTNNTLAKWASAISDTLALGLLTEGIGLGLPIVALPHFNSAQAKHPAVSQHVGVLREAGVTVLLGDDGFVPHPAKQGDLNAYPWQSALNALPH